MTTTSAYRLSTIIAIRYLDAAWVLHKNSPSANAFWEPLNHLFAMSAELALKAFLEGAGVSERELRNRRIRHSLNALLLLAVGHGLRISRDVVDALITMDEAHFTHAYRYVPRPGEAEARTVYSACPGDAFAAIQTLLDQCALDPSEVRLQSKFPDDWPPASLPANAATAEQLTEWIAEKQRHHDFFGGSRHLAD